MRRSRDNDVFLLTGNDIMAIAPLGGTVHQLFDVFILAGISLLAAKCYGFRGRITPQN